MWESMCITLQKDGEDFQICCCESQVRDTRTTKEGAVGYHYHA